MEKTIDKLKFRFQNNKVTKIVNEIKFRSDYLDISIKNILNKKESLLNNKYEEMQFKMLPYADKDFVAVVRDNKIAEVTEKYYWKHRETNQNLKRAQTNSDDALVSKLENDLHDLENNQLTELTQINEVYFDYQEIPQDIQDQNSLYKQEYDEYKIKLEEKTDLRISNLKINTENKITKLQKKLELSKEKLKNLQDSEIDVIMDEDVVLKLNNLCMYFGGLKAVENLSFEVKKGEIYGLIGPNGAGKTTVFNCITRFYKSTHGEAYYRNHENKVILLNDYKVHEVIKQGIVRTFQNVELIWELSILDNLLVAGHSLYQTNLFDHLISSKRLHQEEDVILNKAKKILEDLNLLQYQFNIPLGLPYGILKRIELARTLMVDPKLIILDEPAAGLNEAETLELASLIKKIRDEYQTTIFLVEHDMGLVMNICDTVCAISFGKKLAVGNPEEIQKNKTVQDAYLGGE